jgi:hypothetical protein
MRRSFSVALLALVTLSAPASSGPTMARTTDHLPPASMGSELTADFERLLQEPDAYRTEVNAHAAAFPEGDVFPYVFPIMANTSLAAADPTRRETARQQVGALLELLIPSIESHVGTLDGLRTYKSYATYVGQVGLALGCWRLLGGDDRYDDRHRRVIAVLVSALEARDGAPLDSYPNLVWPFDTMPALVAVRLWDVHTGEDHSELITAHLHWMDRHLDASGLPVSRVHPTTMATAEAARGCDLSYRIALLALLDRDRAEQLYTRYVDHYWLERGIVAGFAEWEGGAEVREDVDSGPIALGIGLGATGLGIAATRSVGDRERWGRLRGELAQSRLALQTMLQLSDGTAPLPLAPGYRTGFLFGDAALFWATTWEDWGIALP